MPVGARNQEEDQVTDTTKADRIEAADKAFAALQRFIDGEGVMRVPTRPDDDDLLIMNVLHAYRDAPDDPQPTANPIRVQVQHVAEVLRELRDCFANARGILHLQFVLEAIDRAVLKVASVPVPVDGTRDWQRTEIIDVLYGFGHDGATAGKIADRIIALLPAQAPAPCSFDPTPATRYARQQIEALPTMPTLAGNLINREDVLTILDRDAAWPPAQAPAQPPVPTEIDFDKVICPSCCHQFQATPVNVQRELNALRNMDEKAQAPSDGGKLRRLRESLRLSEMPDGISAREHHEWVIVLVDRLLAEKPTPHLCPECQEIGCECDGPPPPLLHMGYSKLAGEPPPPIHDAKRDERRPLPPADLVQAVEDGTPHPAALGGKRLRNMKATKVPASEPAQAPAQWQPIATAPAERAVLIAEPGCGMAICKRWPDGRWHDDNGGTMHPTHWMELPAWPSVSIGEPASEPKLPWDAIAKSYVRISDAPASKPAPKPTCESCRNWSPR